MKFICNFDVFYILEFYMFLVFLNYLKICVTRHDASGQTDTKRERHNEVKENIFIF